MSFEIGDYVEIEISEGYFRGEYPSRIVRVLDNKLILETPRLAGSIIPLKLGAILIIHICKEEARYVFDGRVVGLAENAPEQLTVSIPSNIERRSRSDVRLTIRMPVELLYFYRNGIPVASYSISSVDISAGGIRIEVPEEYPLHTKLKLAIVFPDNEEVMAFADVVRVGRLAHPEPGSQNYFWASLRFLNMSDNKKKKILKFIYKQQELRVKGLI
jgi:c-di-GMP-binding flagellar brake protein YcgR